MIIAGWFDFAIREPGPFDRWEEFGRRSIEIKAIICHSMEGDYHPAVYSVLTDPERYPTAWHGTVTKDGVLHQHYGVSARLQHAHSGNELGPGFEAEGFAGGPLTLAQEDTYLKIFRDIGEDTGRLPMRPPRPDWVFATSEMAIREHNEVGPTACPSGRYDHLWERMKIPDEPVLDDHISISNQVATLNEAIMKRLTIINLATGDYQKMLAAHKALEEKRII